MEKQSQKDKVVALIEHFGSQALTARHAEVKQPTVSAWLNEVHGISARSALKLEAASGGKFKASDLCPDLDPVNHIAA